MRKIFCGVILLFISSSLTAQISFDRSNKSLSINTGKVQRLNSGIGLVGEKQAGSIRTSVKNDVALLSLVTTDAVDAKEFAGVFFGAIPELRQGVTIWRYKPWNSWTKPIAVTDATKMEDWDVQFFYWQYEDNIYGAAVPLSGNGFRTTLGSQGNKWGSKAMSYANDKSKEIPCMAFHSATILMNYLNAFI